MHNTNIDYYLVKYSINVSKKSGVKKKKKIFIILMSNKLPKYVLIIMCTIKI